ncbi:uncharacterized protein LOC119994838 isoform X2 [Tripterygium wilfordii]|uniref:uncharacterized protein LOC119994838 isoform X2 n=1 Tax=Tripterygium wilfordii TaxID=458696 RepID=UPI0018F83B21|nr:uncharacterized protein LOC119994838 isoform X2 [Tripterygium wilfordii]
MQKLLKRSHEYLCSIQIPQFKNLSILLPTSHFYSAPETLNPSSKLGFVLDEVEAIQSSKHTNQSSRLAMNTSDESSNESESSNAGKGRTFQISHQWSEWVDLMECLLKRGYFYGEGNPFHRSDLGEKDFNIIRTACLNFGRDRPRLIKCLSRKDIHIVAECGCPSIDRKVVNSGKRLRAHVSIDERNVCSSCNLRGNCERAYIKAREKEGALTVDLMRTLLMYGLDPICATVENSSCQNTQAKGSVRRLLKEIVDYTTQEVVSDLPNDITLQGGLSEQDHLSTQEKGNIDIPMKLVDWQCPKCLRCDDLSQERLKQLREQEEHLPLKKGDWKCDQCYFLNFAKNTRCLRCKEKPPKRELNPGEWDCESCNYINFRKNMVCLKCDHRRPKASNALNASPQSTKEKGVYSGCGSFKFVSSENEVDKHKSGVQDRPGLDMWKFVKEDGEDNDRSISGDRASGIIDFPIIGGKGSLSQDARKREKWKVEMLERIKSAERRSEKNDESGNANTQKGLNYHQACDDVEIAEWFGYRKKMESSSLSEQ